MQCLSPQIKLFDAWQFLKEKPEGFGLNFLHDGETFVLERYAVASMQRMATAYLPIATVIRRKQKAVENSIQIKQWMEQQGAIWDETAQQFVLLQLKQYFTPVVQTALEEIAKHLKQNNIQAYLIGGIPRDILVGKLTPAETLIDIDLTVEGDGVTWATALCEQNKSFVLRATFPQFGTAKLQYKNQFLIDVVSTRTEYYERNGALPTVSEMGVSLEKDVLRRDFTVNTLAMTLNPLGFIVDATGKGISDLVDRQIQILHGATFFEDPTRIYRAYKFANRLQFNLSEDTKATIYSFLNTLKEDKLLSKRYPGGGSRIRDEFRELVKASWTAFIQQEKKYDNWQWTINGALMLLYANIEEGWDFSEIERCLSIGLDKLTVLEDWMKEAPPEEVILCWLLAEKDKDVTTELLSKVELNKQERETVLAYHELRHSLSCSAIDWSNPVAVFELFEKKPLSALLAWLLLQEETKNWIEALKRFWKVDRFVVPILTGDDLIQQNIATGKKIGELLRQLQFQKIKGFCNSKEEELNWLKKNRKFC